MPFAFSALPPSARAQEALPARQALGSLQNSAREAREQLAQSGATVQELTATVAVLRTSLAAVEARLQAVEHARLLPLEQGMSQVWAGVRRCPVRPAERHGRLPLPAPAAHPGSGVVLL